MDYAHPEVLVTTDWVHEHRNDPKVRLLEIDVDPDAYRLCHVPGAVGLDWHVDLCDVFVRDVLSHDRFEQVMSHAGITPDMQVVLYGDSNNWFAAWAFWQMKMYGHERVHLMDGGRTKWLAEARMVTTDVPVIAKTTYAAPPPDARLRAMLPEVQKVVEASSVNLVDVRSPPEFTGEILAPPGLPETCQRGGHIPGAVNVPWSRACREDGTFKTADELRALYAEAGVDLSRPTIAYCRIGERSSHTWFVLKYLIGQSDVKNYDGSWTEWGNLVRAPIAAENPMSNELRPEGYRRRLSHLEGFPIGITTYQLADRHVCLIDNVEPGATIANVSAATAEDAERDALARARTLLAGTARRRETLRNLREHVARLNEVLPRKE